MTKNNKNNNMTPITEEVLNRTFRNYEPQVILYFKLCARGLKKPSHTEFCKIFNYQTISLTRGIIRLTDSRICKKAIDQAFVAAYHKWLFNMMPISQQEEEFIRSRGTILHAYSIIGAPWKN